MTRAAFEAQSQAIAKVFAARGYARVSPPILQPAEVFLDRLGDEVRARLYVFNDPGGSEVCLRPELTIPVCRLYLESGLGSAGIARLSYDGPVYRYGAQSTGEANEIHQAGVECIGVGDREAADSEIVALALEALQAAGVGDAQLTFGDNALFAALVAAIELPDQWRARLLRHFARPHDFQKLLDRLSAARRQGQGGAFLSALGRLSEDEARAVIADVLKLADIQPIGARSLGEIAERYLEQAADASALTIKAETLAVIEAFLRIDAPALEAMMALKALAAQSGLDLSEALARLERRFALLAAAKVDLAAARFSTGFGRAMDYYTGFVFQASLNGIPLAAGGRYDTLLTMLGAAKDTPAAGFAIFSEAVLAAERPAS